MAPQSTAASPVVFDGEVNKGGSASTNGQAFQFLDLKAQFAEIRDEVMQAIERVMESQHFILGGEVRDFERECANLLEAPHAIGCASGSDALLLALLALGIGAGDEVVTSPFTFVATAGSIARVGAKPVFVDIEPDTFNIDVTKIEDAITLRTKAIMPVHLFGRPADLDPILAIARAKRIAVIEDAAQAIGSRYKGKCAGTLGELGCFSFFPSKNLGAAGDGGLVTAADPELAERLRILRVHGSKKKYHHEILGINSRLDALQAAVLRVKLRRLAEWTDARRQKAERYRQLFKAAGLADFLTLPSEELSEYFHVYNQFTIRCRQRDALHEFLQVQGIPTEIYYPRPLHLQPAFAYLGYRAGQFPEAEAASEQVISLSAYPELKNSQQDAIVAAVAEFYRPSRN